MYGSLWKLHVEILCKKHRRLQQNSDESLLQIQRKAFASKNNREHEWAPARDKKHTRQDTCLHVAFGHLVGQACIFAIKSFSSTTGGASSVSLLNQNRGRLCKLPRDKKKTSKRTTISSEKKKRSRRKKGRYRRNQRKKNLGKVVVKFSRR